MNLFANPFASVPIRIVVDELIRDDRVFVIEPQPVPRDPMWFVPRDPAWIMTASTRGFGALCAYNLAAAYRPDGVQ